VKIYLAFFLALAPSCKINLALRGRVNAAFL
jgi:hypothetical protein